MSQTNPKPDTFEGLVSQHFDELNDSNWKFLEETGVAEPAGGDDITVHGVSVQNVAPVIENLCNHLGIWLVFAASLGVEEDKLVALVKDATEAGRKLAADMGEVFRPDGSAEN